MQFISPTLAYTSVAGGLAKLVRFGPSDMRITGEAASLLLVLTGLRKLEWRS